MSIQTVARKFVEMCNQGKNFDVMHTMYAPDIVSVEGDGKETAGQDTGHPEVRGLGSRQHDPRRKGPRPVLQRPQPVRRPLHLRSHPQGHRPADHARRSRRLHRQETTRSRASSFSHGKHTLPDSRVDATQ